MPIAIPTHDGRVRQQFPVSRLGIDRSFITGLPQDGSDRTIVSASIGLPRSLGLDVVAEGVETQARRDCLHTLECSAYQGFVRSPAVPAAQFKQLLVVLRD